MKAPLAMMMVVSVVIIGGRGNEGKQADGMRIHGRRGRRGGTFSDDDGSVGGIRQTRGLVLEGPLFRKILLGEYNLFIGMWVVLVIVVLVVPLLTMATAASLPPLVPVRRVR